MSTAIQTFFKDATCVIADPSSAFSASVKASLVHLGVLPTSIYTTNVFQTAKELIAAKKPKILITEYALGEENGLALVDAIKKCAVPNNISIMITNDSSDSIVAEAAEEQVDAFLIKPFSADNFLQKLEAVIDAKLNPTPYALQIEQGKKLLEKNEYAQAIEIFNACKKLKDKPALACYYAGLAHQQNKDFEKALAEYKEGRTYSPLHYLSLFGQFEILVNAKRFNEAHELVGLIQDNFPLTPYRLGQILISVVFSGKFEELNRCYQNLLNLQKRPVELTRVAVQAFVAAGRHFLRTGDLAQSTVYFEKALLISGRDIQVLEKIVNDFIAVKKPVEALNIISKASKQDLNNPIFHRLTFKIDYMTLPKHQVIERGRKLVFEGNGTSEIYMDLVKLLVQEGKAQLAETIILKGVEQFPALRTPLYSILEGKAA